MIKKQFLISTFILLSALTLFSTDSVHAENADTSKPKSGYIEVIAEGEALLGDDTTKAQAKAAARNNARVSALEQAVGVQVRGSTLLYNSSLINDLVVTATKGLIVKEEVMVDAPRIKDDQISYYFKIKAQIKPISSDKRSSLKVIRTEVIRADSDKSLRSPVFQQNDEIQIRLQANADAYINIFSVSQDGQVSKLFPNKYVKIAPLSAKDTMIFPDNSQRAIGLKLRVTTPKKLSRAIESVVVIATKDQVDFLSDTGVSAPMITDLMRELSEVDPSLWAQKTVGYEVRK